MAKKTKPKAKTSNKKVKSKAKKVAPKQKTKAKPKPKATRKAAPVAQTLPKDLSTRLQALATQMDKTMDALMLQALCEFADAWEDHYRTIQAMTDEDDRIQLVVKPGQD